MSNLINPGTGIPVPTQAQIGTQNLGIRNADPQDSIWHAGGRATRDDAVDASAKNDPHYADNIQTSFGNPKP